MIISAESTIEETRRNLEMGFSCQKKVPRVFYTPNILDVIAGENYKKVFDIKYRFEHGKITYVRIYGNCNDFCKLMHIGGHFAEI